MEQSKDTNWPGSMTGGEDSTGRWNVNRPASAFESSCDMKRPAWRRSIRRRRRERWKTSYERCINKVIGSCEANSVLSKAFISGLRNYGSSIRILFRNRNRFIGFGTSCDTGCSGLLPFAKGTERRSRPCRHASYLSMSDHSRQLFERRAAV